MAVKFFSLYDQQYVNSLSYRSSNDRDNKTHHSTLLDVPIVGIDGEGYNDKEKDHHYDLIVAAGEDWWEHQREEIELTPKQIFEFLLSLPEKHGKALYFIYGGSYDFNMWIKRLPERNLKQLPISGRTRWKQYRISWKPKREIYIQDITTLECMLKHKPKDSSQKKHQHNYRRTIHIYDVIGFFQMSFVEALKDWKTTDEETLLRIANMKKQRGDFSEVEKAKILDYCLEECQLLVKLGGEFRAACNRADIRPHHWYGAGALASTLMRSNGIKLHLPEHVASEVKLFQIHAYFGGRTEISYQGRLPDGGYQYDINSAYPTAMVDLPCIVHGEWKYHTNSARNYSRYKYGMWHIKWTSHGSLWNPFPWRSKDGRIFYPDKGEGIYHKVEIDAALALYPDYDIEILEGWTYTTKCQHKPFGFIPARAEYRLKLKAEKEPAAKPLKLGLNSLYGKTAQTLGKNPPYQNFFWAGLITAITRAKLLNAIRCCSGTVYSVATDGLISSVEIDQLKVGATLGTWEKTKIVEGFLVKPGIYKWKDNSGNPEKEWHYGTRGFTKDEAKWEEIEGLWDRKQFVKKWSFPANRFIGLMQAFHRGEGWRDWFGKWIEQPREMSFHPTVMTREWDIPPAFYILTYPLSEALKIEANLASFIKLKYTCWCNREFIHSAEYRKALMTGTKEFFQLIIDEDQP